MKRCSFLDRNGKQCKNQAKFKYNYHGDGEIYYNNSLEEKIPTWVRVNFCQKHKIK